MSTPPITLDDAKAHLNITTDIDDAVVSAKLSAATAFVEQYTGTLFEDFEGGIPEPLKEAVRQVTSHFYENREPVLVGISGQEIPLSVFNLISPYQRWEF